MNKENLSASGASALSFLKVIFWIGVGAAATAGLEQIPDLHIPAQWQAVASVIIGAVLKSLATYAATKQKESKA